MVQSSNSGNYATAFAAVFTETKLIVRLAVPICMAIMANYFINLTDTLIVGRLGIDELAAVGIAADLQLVFEIAGFSILPMVTVLYGRSLAAAAKSRDQSDESGDSMKSNSEVAKIAENPSGSENLRVGQNTKVNKNESIGAVDGRSNKTPLVLSEDSEPLAAIARSGLVVIGIFCLGIFGWVGIIPKIMEWSDLPATIEPIATQFLRYSAWAVPMVLLTDLLAAIITAKGGKALDRLAIMWIGLVVLNIPIAWLLVHGVAGIGGSGVIGVGVSRIVIAFISLIATYWIGNFTGLFFNLRKTSHDSNRQPWLKFRDLNNYGGTIVKQGVPIIMMNIFEFTMFIGVGLLIGKFGTHWLAANKIVYSILEFVFFLGLSIGTAATVRIATIIGRQSPTVKAELWHTAASAMGLGIVIALLFAILFWTVPHLLFAIFVTEEVTDYQAAKDATISLMAIAALFQIFDMVQAVTARMLRGFLDTRVPMLITLVGYWVIGIGGGWVIAYPLGVGARGLWMGLAAGLLIASILLLWRFVNRTNRQATMSQMTQ